MRSFKTKTVTVIATAVAVLAFAGVAYAGAGTLRHDRDKLKDGSCLTTVAAGTGCASTTARGIRTS